MEKPARVERWLHLTQGAKGTWWAWAAEYPIPAHWDHDHMMFGHAPGEIHFAPGRTPAEATELLVSEIGEVNHAH